MRLSVSLLILALLTSPAFAQTEALSEVNAARARRGLRPFIFDANLTAGAKACAVQRAKYLCFGHTKNDFNASPIGSIRPTATGCAAYPPRDGWLSCCVYEKYTFAGAAFAMGRDGRRYMSLFVR